MCGCKFFSVTYGEVGGGEHKLKIFKSYSQSGYKDLMEVSLFATGENYLTKNFVIQIFS
jgi:hypothetical protein